MYQSLHKKSGVTAVADWVNQFVVQPGPDGLTLATPGPQENMAGEITIPQRLFAWLVDLRLLRHIPLCYLVPDEALLPTESIRFFHVDYSWLDRLIDGVFAAANTGTVDATFTYSLLSGVRVRLDEALEQMAVAQVSGSSWKAGKDPLTGLLIRSDLVRRWPDMIVRAYATAADTFPLPVLRNEAISKDIYIALFAGQPARVDVCEPKVGTRFGVEGQQVGDYKVDKRGPGGEDLAGAHVIPFRGDGTRRVVEVAQLLNLIHPQPAHGTARMIALHLEQRPFQQIFLGSTPESRGVVSPTTFLQPDGSVLTFKLTRGREMNMARFVARLRELGLENE